MTLMAVLCSNSSTFNTSEQNSDVFLTRAAPPHHPPFSALPRGLGASVSSCLNGFSVPLFYAEGGCRGTSAASGGDVDNTASLVSTVRDDRQQELAGQT